MALALLSIGKTFTSSARCMFCPDALFDKLAGKRKAPPYFLWDKNMHLAVTTLL